jgi:hypothetical protein
MDAGGEEAHINTQLPEMREPVRRYSVERVGVVNSIDNTDDMSLADLRLKMSAVVWSSWLAVWA